jgi:cell surface protein SprA
VDLLNKIVQDKWLVKDSTQNVLFMRTHNSNLTANATYEPFKGFRVTLTANRTYTENYQANYRWIPSDNDFRLQNPLSMGNFTMSYMTIMTAFGNQGANFSSLLFKRMLDYRSEISGRLAQANDIAGVYNPNAQYQVGYGKTQQDVLLYSFLAAYTGTDPMNQSMDMFPQIPIPNWRIQFDGLKDIPWIKKFLKNIVLTHAYQSTYSLAGFQSNYVYNGQPSSYWEQHPFGHSELDDNGNFISRYFLNSVSLVESFNPLIKVDMTFNNSLTANVEIKSSRNIALNFPNSQITENNTFEIIVGAGYVVKDVKLPFRLMGKQIKSNLTIRFDFGLRDNSTVIRKIKEEIEQVTAGQRAITIKGFAEYALNQNLSVRIFVDQIINNPFVANQFPTSNTNAGLSLRFTLTQ